MENANRRWTRTRRRILWAGLGLMAGAAILAYLFWGRGAGPAYVQVRRGTIRGTVLATGEVVSGRKARVASMVVGRVSFLAVEPGDEVVSGTVLVTIEAQALNFRVEEARLQLEIARLRLTQAQRGVRPEEVALAQADLDMANARLAALLASPRAQEIWTARQAVLQAQTSAARAREWAAMSAETARLHWEMAASALREAQDDCSRMCAENERSREGGVEPGRSRQDAETSARRRLEHARALIEEARLAYEQALHDHGAAAAALETRLEEARELLQPLLIDPLAGELAQAHAQVSRAEAYLALQRAGVQPAEVKIREEELRLAELALLQAQADLDKATVRAPFDGTVVEVAVEEGDYVGVNSALVSLADLGELEVLARIDEIDVGQVTPGQAVTLTLDAFPGQPLRGYVEETAPAVSVERGSAVYLSTIAFASPPAVPLRLGMAANLTIVTAEKEGVLLVPRRAVSRAGAGHYVTVLRGGRQERVRVVLGIADPEYYEVLAGVSEGERVVVP